MTIHAGPEDRLNQMIADGSARRLIASLRNSSLLPADVRLSIDPYAEDMNANVHATLSSQPPTTTPSTDLSLPPANPPSRIDPHIDDTNANPHATLPSLPPMTDQTAPDPTGNRNPSPN